MNRKWVLSFLFILVAFPVVAQANHKNDSGLGQKIDAAVQRAQAKTTAEKPAEMADPHLLALAEERLQKDRDAHSGRAQHDLAYYYNQVKQEQQAVPVDFSTEYDPYFLTRAEELLQKDRDAHSGNAVHTLDYYYQQVVNENQEETKPQSTNTQATQYYIPLVQLKEEAQTPGADGPEAGIMWVEIGGEYTADGYEPEFFYLTSKKVVFEFNYDGPTGPGLEEIKPAIFNEAYRRLASDPRSAKATINQIKQILTKYYRQVEAEQKNKAQLAE